MASVPPSTICAAAADPAHLSACNSSRIVSRSRSAASCNGGGHLKNSRVLWRKPEAAFRTSFFSGSINSIPGEIFVNLSVLHCKATGRGARCGATLDALIFDCDGVILESEDLHRRAYNLTFEQFSVKCGAEPVFWDTEFYDVLQNTIGGGKPKMRWYFGKNGWPSSTVLDNPPESVSDQNTLIDALQDWKTDKYKDLIRSGAEPRPGVLELMDEARSLGLKVAVCSAATKSSVVFCLTNLLGKERFEQLDCFLAGDDVTNKKPDPSIYITAAEKLGAESERCLVIEDSVIGLQAALGAGMKCIITFTSSTSKQDFTGANATYTNLAGVRFKELLSLVGAAPAPLQNS